MRRALLTWSRPPRTLRRPSTQFDNIATVPASELASLTFWQVSARRLPAGNTLLVVPIENVKLMEVSRRIRLTLQHAGRQASVIYIPDDH